MKSSSTPITAIAESSNLNKCLVFSSSFEWVIDYRATYHMTDNSSLLSTFQSQPSTFTVILADGSQSCVLRLGTIFPTPSIPLSSVLSLPNFSFNLMSVSKLTRAHKCYISFFFLIFVPFRILSRNRLLVKDVSFGVSTFLIMHYQDLSLIPKYYIIWDALCIGSSLSFIVEKVVPTVFKFTVVDVGSEKGIEGEPLRMSFTRVAIAIWNQALFG